MPRLTWVALGWLVAAASLLRAAPPAGSSQQQQHHTLCLDGTGVRGLLPVSLLQILMNTVSDESGIKVYPTDLFDSFCGLSTSAISATLINIPNPYDTSKPLYELSDLVLFYKKTLPGILRYNSEHEKADTAETSKSLHQEQRTHIFKKILRDLVGERPFASMLKTVFVPTLVEKTQDLDMRQGNSLDMPNPVGRPARMLNVLMAASATPSLLKPWKVNEALHTDACLLAPHAASCLYGHLFSPEDSMYRAYKDKEQKEVSLSFESLNIAYIGGGYASNGEDALREIRCIDQEADTWKDKLATLQAKGPLWLPMYSNATKAYKQDRLESLAKNHSKHFNYIHFDFGLIADSQLSWDAVENIAMFTEHTMLLTTKKSKGSPPVFKYPSGRVQKLYEYLLKRTQLHKKKTLEAIDAIENKKAVNLQDCNLTREALKHFCKKLSPQVKYLRLNRCRLSAHELRELVACLKSKKSLVCLDLSENDLFKDTADSSKASQYLWDLFTALDQKLKIILNFTGAEDFLLKKEDPDFIERMETLMETSKEANPLNKKTLGNAQKNLSKRHSSEANLIFEFEDESTEDFLVWQGDPRLKTKPLRPKPYGRHVALCLEGSGLQGYGLAFLLNDMEKELNKRLFCNNKKMATKAAKERWVRISDCLDIVSSISTSSIIASALATPLSMHYFYDTPKYTCSEILKFYEKAQGTLFQNPNASGSYDTKDLDSALEVFLGEGDIDQTVQYVEDNGYAQKRHKRFLSVVKKTMDGQPLVCDSHAEATMKDVLRQSFTSRTSFDDSDGSPGGSLSGSVSRSSTEENSSFVEGRFSSSGGESYGSEISGTDSLEEESFFPNSLTDDIFKIHNAKGVKMKAAVRASCLVSGFFDTENPLAEDELHGLQGAAFFWHPPARETAHALAELTSPGQSDPSLIFCIGAQAFDYGPPPPAKTNFSPDLLSMYEYNQKISDTFHYYQSILMSVERKDIRIVYIELPLQDMRVISDPVAYLREIERSLEKKLKKFHFSGTQEKTPAKYYKNEQINDFFKILYERAKKIKPSIESRQDRIDAEEARKAA